MPWKQNIPEWIPFATAVAGKVQVNPPWMTRLAELVIVGMVSSYGTIKTLEYEVTTLKTQFVVHEKQNTEYRVQAAKDRSDDDRKWDARIARLENCFIVRNCGAPISTSTGGQHGR